MKKDKHSKEKTIFSILSLNVRWIQIVVGFLFVFLFLSVSYLGVSHTPTKEAFKEEP